MLIRNDILISVNILRSIIEQPRMEEVNVVIHCNYHSAHTMLSGNIFVNGAVDFVKDILAISTQCC